jgi:oligopeptidase B
MNDREDPDVLAYLRAENAYTDAVMATPRTSRSASSRRSAAGSRRRTCPCRTAAATTGTTPATRRGRNTPSTPGARGSLDGPRRSCWTTTSGPPARRSTTRAWQVSPGDDILAFAEDTVGRNIVTIRFKDLRTGEMLTTSSTGVTWNMAWAEDNRTLFYATPGPGHAAHVPGLPPRSARTPAPRSWSTRRPTRRSRTGVFKTKSRDYMVIGSSHTLTDEYRYTPATGPDGRSASSSPGSAATSTPSTRSAATSTSAPTTAQRTSASCARPWTGPAGSTGRRSSPTATTSIQGFDVFRDHLVLSERKDGLTQLRVRPWSGVDEHYVAFDEEAYVVFPAQNPEADTARCASYQSMTTPLDLRLRHGDAGADAAQARRRSWAATTRRSTARSGSWPPPATARACPSPRLPPRPAADGPQPLLLYGYGSYGASMDPGFSSIRLSLLDRGFIYAIAHIRGGQEFGPGLVRGGQAAQQEEHVLRLHRRRRAPGRGRLHRRPTALRGGRQRRRPAHGRRRQPTGRTCSTAPSPRSRSWTSSPRCSTRRSP